MNTTLATFDLAKFYVYVQEQAVITNSDAACKAYTRIIDRILNDRPDRTRLQWIIQANIGLTAALIITAQHYADQAIMNEYRVQSEVYKQLLATLNQENYSNTAS